MRTWKTAFAVAALAVAFSAWSFADDKAASQQHAKVGQPAPAFSLQDQDGKTHNLADYAGKIVVLEWFNEDCPVVQRHYDEKTMNTLADKYKGQEVVWLAINSTSGKDNAANKKAADTWSMQRPILNDADGKTGKAYGAKTTPHMYIIDKEGKLAYKGGIDNDQRGNKADGKVNYVEKALDELLAGSTVSVAETKEYGCGVKYAK